MRDPHIWPCIKALIPFFMFLLHLQDIVISAEILMIITLLYYFYLNDLIWTQNSHLKLNDRGGSSYHMLIMKDFTRATSLCMMFLASISSSGSTCYTEQKMHKLINRSWLPWWIFITNPLRHWQSGWCWVVTWATFSIIL